MRITRSVGEKMIAAYPDLWYHDSTCSPAGLKVYNLFDFELLNHQYFTEDYVFCRRFRAIGGKVWVDPILELDHTWHESVSRLPVRLSATRVHPEGRTGGQGAAHDARTLPRIPQGHCSPTRATNGHHLAIRHIEGSVLPLDLALRTPRCS
jgi:hypothetical protein